MEGFLIFLIRFTPFWAVPLLMIFIELGRRLRNRDANRAAFFIFTLAFFCLLAIAYYIYAGGPDRAVELFEG